MPSKSDGGGAEGGAAGGVARRRVSMSELSAHADASSCWVALHGVVYDLTSFVDEHPGGAYMILLGKGTDCTLLFER